MTTPDAQTHREQLARAAEVVVTAQDGSPSLVQRQLYVTYARADSLLEELERYKVVAPRPGTRSRQVLVAPDELAEVLDQIRGGA